jgi:hypothetical protein
MQIVDGRLSELIALRGKKGIKSSDQVTDLRFLAAKANKFGAKCRLPVLMHLIMSHFDAVRSIDATLRADNWRVREALISC